MSLSLQLGRNPIEPHRVKEMIDIVQSAPNGTLQCLGLDGITITLKVAKLLKDMQESHAHLQVPHGGTGGYREPKPLLEPHEKLMKYAKENNLELRDLFQAFDKEQKQALAEEGFRNALKVTALLLGAEQRGIAFRKVCSAGISDQSM